MTSDPHGIPLLDVTPPTPATLEPGQAPPAAPRWSARAVEVRGDLFGSVPLKVCARFPWSGSALTVADFLFFMDDVRARWRGRFSVAARLDAGGNGGIIAVVRPDSAERVDAPFALLPAPARGRDGPTRHPAAPAYEAVREAFRSLPAALEYAWALDPPTGALLLLGGDWRVLPRNFAGTVVLHVLRFSPPAAPPVMRIDPPEAAVARAAGARDLSPGLQGYTFELDCRPAAGSDAKPFDSITWSVEGETCESARPDLPLAASQARQADPPVSSSSPTRSTVGDAASGRTDGNLPPHPADPAPATATAPTPPPPRARLEGSLTLAPADYGLLAELRWDQGGADAPSPYPVGRRVEDPGGPAVPMAVGFRVGKDGAPMASLPTAGTLAFNNLSNQPLRVRLSPAESVRLAATETIVPAAGRAEVPVQRRRTITGSEVPRYRTPEVRCLAEPVSADDAPTGPPIELRVGPARRSADLPTLCLPARDTADLVLPSWSEEGSWRFPVEVAGGAAADLGVGPADRPDAAARGAVPADCRAGTRRAEVCVPGQPTKLLEWFEMPMDALAGELEFRHDRADSLSLTVPYPFRARIDGGFCVARSLDARHGAGLAFALPFDLLVSDDAALDPTVQWRWDGAAPGPYDVACELYVTPPAVALPSLPEGMNGDAGQDGRPRPARARVTSFPSAVVEANAARHRRRWLLVRPLGPSGWEEGAWGATIVLSGPGGRVLDEVPVTYAVEPLLPRLGVRIGSAAGPQADPTFEFAVSNLNPFRSLSIVSLNLSAEIRLRGVKVEEARPAFDNGSPPGSRVAAGETRTWAGRLSAGRNRVLRSLRRVPGLGGVAGFAGKRARVDLSLRAACEGRSESAYTWRAEGEVEIG